MAISPRMMTGGLPRGRRLGLPWILLALGLGCHRAPERPVLVIASDATFAPFHFLDASGAPTGFELELARLAAERAGFRPEVVVVPYEELLTGLASGDHDIVAASTGITEERERRYLFTTAYFRTCQVALARNGEDEPRALAELEERRVGASGGGTSWLALRELPGVERVPLGKGQRGVPTLLGGVIDALVLDEYDAVEAARASGDRLRVLSEPVALERYAFVLARGRDDLKRALDGALERIEGEGTLVELTRRFGVERDEDWPVRCGSATDAARSAPAGSVR